jgi:hypothetical protein
MQNKSEDLAKDADSRKLTPAPKWEVSQDLISVLRGIREHIPESQLSSQDQEAALRHLDHVASGEDADGSFKALSDLLIRAGSRDARKLRDRLCPAYAVFRKRVRATDSAGPRMDQHQVDADGSHADAPDVDGEARPDEPSAEGHARPMVVAGGVPTPTGASDVKTPPAEDRESDGLKLSALEVSFWNRSHGCEPDADHVSRLKDSIEKDRLYYPLRLVPIPSSPGRYAIIGGANRYLALRALRGEDGVLLPGEYIILDDLTEDDPACMRISYDENDIQRKPSPFELACLVERVRQRKAVTDAQLIADLPVSRQELSALRHLPALFDQLPESWKRDLRLSSSGRDRDSAPAITLSHWRIVAATLKKCGVTAELCAILEKAAAENCSTKQLRQSLGEAKTRGTRKEQGGDGGKPTPKPEETPESKDPGPTQDLPPVEGTTDDRTAPPGGDTPTPPAETKDATEILTGTPTPVSPPLEEKEDGPHNEEPSPGDGEPPPVETDFDCLVHGLQECKDCAGWDLEIWELLNETNRKILDIQEQRAGVAKP